MRKLACVLILAAVLAPSGLAAPRKAPTPAALAAQLCRIAKAKYPQPFAAKYGTVAKCVKFATPLAAAGLAACKSLGAARYASCVKQLEATGSARFVGK